MEDKIKDFIIKFDKNFTEIEKNENIQNYKSIYNKGLDYEFNSSIFKNYLQVLDDRINACCEYYKIVCCVNKYYNQDRKSVV